MNTPIPSALQVRSWLVALDGKQLQKLADLSKVPFGTLWKIRSADTKDPRIETVRQISMHLAEATKEPAKA